MRIRLLPSSSSLFFHSLCSATQLGNNNIHCNNRRWKLLVMPCRLSTLRFIFTSKRNVEGKLSPPIHRPRTTNNPISRSVFRFSFSFWSFPPVAAATRHHHRPELVLYIRNDGWNYIFFLFLSFHFFGAAGAVRFALIELLVSSRRNLLEKKQQS